VCVHASRGLLFAEHLQHTAAGVFLLQKQGVALQARIQVIPLTNMLFRYMYVFVGMVL
jgi:hypothetical protein